jgi:hypothetical protein
MNPYFGTSGWQLDNDNWMQKIPLEHSGRKTPEGAIGRAGFERRDAGSDPVTAAARSWRRGKTAGFMGILADVP